VLAAFDLSDQLYVMATLDLPSVRNMGVFLGTLERLKLSTDNVTPSGNSVAASNLLALAGLLSRPEYVERCEQCIRSSGPILEEHPSAVPQLAVALAAWLDAAPQPRNKTEKKATPNSPEDSK